MPDVTAASSIRGDHLPASTPMKGKCDVCTKPDQFQGHFLLKCKQCGVLVHELCYGLNPKGKHDPNFICLACKYIGSKIEVNIPSIIGGCGEDMSKTREFMTQMERPKECVLCNHHEGIHAIHPLYDTHGPEGRHYVLPQTGDLAHRKEKRLAWVHTLCASFLGDYFQTRGCVYGCDIYGNYDHDDESDDEEEDENDEFCYYCGKTGGEILCCDGCVKAFHSDCLKVEDVSSLPDPWYCPFCESLCKQDEAKGAKDFPSGKEERGNCNPSDSDAVARFKIGTKVSKYFLDEKIGQKRPFAGEVVNYFHQRKRYRVRYDEDGEEEDLTENQIAKIQGLPQEKIMNVHHFVIDNKSEFIKGLRNLKCVICKSTNGKLRIPVQCTAGTDHVLDCFPDSLRADEKDRKSGNQGCLHAIHVGCARWKAREKYARYKGKAVRLCYYYPGQKANFEEDCDGKTKIITKDPKSNIFCRTHCHEIINSQVMTS